MGSTVHTSEWLPVSSEKDQVQNSNWFSLALVTFFVAFFAGTALFLCGGRASVIVDELGIGIARRAGLSELGSRLKFSSLGSDRHEIFLARIIQGYSSRVDGQALAQAIVKESRRAGFDPLLVAAIIHAESTFNHRAVSNKGARGLMQILPATGQYISGKASLAWYGSQRLGDVNYNIRLGIAYLKYLQSKFGGNLEKALIAYNWGPGNLIKAQKSGGIYIPKASVQYARKILSNHRKWSQDLGKGYLRADNLAAHPTVS